VVASFLDAEMVLIVLRALFILLMAAVGWFYVKSDVPFMGNYNWLALAIAVAAATLFICLDIISPRRKLSLFSGTFLGLIVGLSMAYAMSFMVRYLIEAWHPITLTDFYISADVKAAAIQQMTREREVFIEFCNMMVGVASVYLSISLILQTKDDFRFIVPYVEFSKQTKGARPMLLDTSVLIDGRIADIAESGILESRMLVPRFVLDELQSIADSNDRLMRNRGRRGLDVLQKLQNNRRLEVVLYESHPQDESKEVDQKLTSLAKELNGRVLTTDFNLNKVAQLRGVDVININDLARAMKPVVLPGETMVVRLMKPGEESGQGVGYLEDGTMVVVEHGRAHLNEDVEFIVTSALQTSAGKMIFGRLGENGQNQQTAAPARRGRPKSETTT